MKRIPITRLELAGDVQDIGAAACRALPPGRRYRYKQAGVHTLANGQQVGTSLHAKTKPELQRKIADRTQEIADGRLVAEFFDNGEYAGLSLTLHIHPPGQH